MGCQQSNLYHCYVILTSTWQRIRESLYRQWNPRPSAVWLLLIKRSHDRMNPTNPSSQEFRRISQPCVGHCVLTRELKSRINMLWLGCKGAHKRCFHNCWSFSSRSSSLFCFNLRLNNFSCHQGYINLLHPYNETWDFCIIFRLLNLNDLSKEA